MSESSRPTRPFRVGVQLQPQHATYTEIRRAVDAAEEAGVDIVFNWDHFYPLSGPADGPNFECWSMLAAWAEQTSRVEISALVTCNSYRNPDLLADMARTVDHISDGRLILAIGAGWFEKDYDAYGYEFGTAGTRIDALGDSLARIVARWEQLNPAPTRKIPIMVGGGGEKKTLPLVAKYADIWHGFGDLDTLRRKTGILDGYCTDLGRDAGEIERSTAVQQSPDQLGDGIRDLGFTLVTTDCDGRSGYDLGLTREWVAYRDEVNGA